MTSAIVVVADHGDLAATRSAAPTPGPQAAAARAAVIRALHACDDALAAWEAGSAAFGRADLTSDLDVGVIARDGTGPAILGAIEEQLRDLTELDVWDVGDSKFGVQRFWQPTQPGTHAPICMVDVSVLGVDADADKVRELLTVERHGRALSLHDPNGLLERTVAANAFDVDAHRARVATELDRIRERHAMLSGFGPKELDRGRVLDAHWIRDTMVVLPLVTLLGMVHRPLRFDFALRYLHAELPTDVVDCLVPIVEPGPERVRDAIVEGVRWIDALLAAIDPDLLPIERHAEDMRTAFG